MSPLQEKKVCYGTKGNVIINQKVKEIIPKLVEIKMLK